MLTLVFSLLVASPCLSLKFTVKSKSDRPKLTNELLDKIIVVPENKLLFCYIEKVACQNFNQLFRYVRSRYDPRQEYGKDWRRNTPEIHGLSKNDIEDILTDPTWHKAVFYRDPIERFASAYASKCGCVHKDGAWICYEQFGKTNESFAEAVSFVGKNGTDETGFNEHFLRQGDFCGGLVNTLKYYNTVEELERNTSHEKIATLLRKVSIDPKSVPHFAELFPPPEDGSWTNGRHNTDVSDELATYFPVGEPWRADVLYKHYYGDYQLFGMSKPSWSNAVKLVALHGEAGEAEHMSIDTHWPLLDLSD